MVPVDEPWLQPRIGRNDKGVCSPKIPMQERLRTAQFIQRLRAAWLFVLQFLQPREQGIAYRQLPRGEFDPGWPEALQVAKGITHVRREKIDSKIGAVEPALRQQRMFGKADVNLGDQVHRSLHTLLCWIVGHQRPITEVLIDMPHALATALRGGAQQYRAVVAQSDRRQPAAYHQLIALGDARFKTLDDQRTHSVAIDAKTQAKHARMRH